MKILVTGGAGYLGSTLVGYLLNAHYNVTVLDSFLHRENSLAAYCHDKRFDVIRADTRDANLLASIVHLYDVVIPLAAIVGAPACDRDPTAARTTNHDAVLTVLKNARGRVIYPNSNSGYGTSPEPCTEETPLHPISLYAASKCWAEDAVRQYPEHVVFRLATVFGASPRMRTDLIVNDFVLRAVRDRSIVLYEPHARRNFVHVRDVARAFVHALEHWDAMKGQVFNVGDTRANMDKRELAACIKRHTPLDAYIGEGSDGDKRDYLVSNAKLESVGWRPAFSLDDGIAELIKLYRGLSNTRYSNV